MSFPELQQLRCEYAEFLDSLPALIEAAQQNECLCGSITSELQGCDFCSAMTKVYRQIELMALKLKPVNPAYAKASHEDTSTRSFPFTKKRSCNIHLDCDEADAKMRNSTGGRAAHCHDDCCPDCFGQ